MSLSVTFHRAAQAELVEASAWYEGKQQGLAAEFVAEIERCITLVSERSAQFAVIRQDIRRIVVHRFPYCVYFKAEKSRIVVLAVFHSSRDPSIWSSRN